MDRRIKKNTIRLSKHEPPPLAAQPWFWMVLLFFPFFSQTNYRTTDNFTPVKNIWNSDINTMVPRDHSELWTCSYPPVLFQKGKDVLVHKQVIPVVTNVKIIWGRCYLWLCKRAKLTEISGTGRRWSGVWQASVWTGFQTFRPMLFSMAHVLQI